MKTSKVSLYDVAMRQMQERARQKRLEDYGDEAEPEYGPGLTKFRDEMLKKITGAPETVEAVQEAVAVDVIEQQPLAQVVNPMVGRKPLITEIDEIITPVFNMTVESPDVPAPASASAHNEQDIAYQTPAEQREADRDLRSELTFAVDADYRSITSPLLKKEEVEASGVDSQIADDPILELTFATQAQEKTDHGKPEEAWQADISKQSTLVELLSEQDNAGE